MHTEAISATYMDHMGTDLTVVNAARASFSKESTWELVGDPFCAPQEHKLPDADARLIQFLARGYTTQQWDELAQVFLNLEDKSDVQSLLTQVKAHPQHWAPFAHPHIQIRITAPIFLARQFVKHQIGGVWSEESRRYIDDEPSFWFPKVWHARPESVKQGSGDELNDQAAPNSIADMAVETSLQGYRNLITLGTAPEEARIVLPLNMMTTWVWTGSLLFYARVANLRMDSHAQRAAQELGRQIANAIKPLFPVSWPALVAHE